MLDDLLEKGESIDIENYDFIDFNINITTVSYSFISQQYSLSLNQNELQNRANFITLGKILEQEKIEIIKLGFQLNQEGKISLKKYYESTDPYSLFQLKGYNIKYESIRRTKLYQNLKE